MWQYGPILEHGSLIIAKGIVTYEERGVGLEVQQLKALDAPVTTAMGR